MSIKRRGPGPVADKSLRKQIEAIKKEKIVSKKVVSLDEFRGLKEGTDRKTILVVDDDEIMRSALKRILEQENYRVELAPDAIELSKILESQKLDMILLDVNMPWIDGFELCGLLKQHPSLKDVPLILVSARKSQEDIQAGFDAGCNDYVTKPFDIDYMTGVINKNFQKSS